MFYRFLLLSMVLASCGHGDAAAAVAKAPINFGALYADAAAIPQPSRFGTFQLIEPVSSGESARQYFGQLTIVDTRNGTAVIDHMPAILTQGLNGKSDIVTLVAGTIADQPPQAANGPTTLGLLGIGYSVASGPIQNDPIRDAKPGTMIDKCQKADAPFVVPGTFADTLNEPTWEDDDPLITLYRGVNSGNPELSDAKNGTVFARKLDANIWPWMHVNNMHNSQYTSWTLDPATAINYAGNGGVVLKACFPQSSLARMSAAHEKTGIKQVLVPGVVRGAAVIPVSN